VPAFSVLGADGVDISYESYRGEVLLVVFARPEHEKSLHALKIAQEILEQCSDSKLAVLGISTKTGSEEYFSQIVAEGHLTFPIASDPGREAYGRFGVVVAPTTLLIDGDGIVRFIMPHVRLGHDRQLRVHTDMLLGRISQEEHDAKLSLSNQGVMEGQDAWTRRLGLAEQLMEQGRSEQAIPILTELQAERESTTVVTLLGTSLLEVGRTDEAAQWLEPLASHARACPRAKLALARLELRRGNEAAAERYLLEAVAQSPKKGPILFQLGQLYEQRGDLAKAVDCYRRALEAVYDRS
jgi:tetratricopeptide (TPR) repeat protein